MIKNNQGNKAYVNLKSSTIMLVDDEPVLLDIVQALLEDEGYQNFVSVQYSPEAIDRMIDTNPDLILLDLDMPEVGGFEILENVRKLEKYQHLPIIILTASDEPANKLKALELGATDFLSKPVDPSELALRVRNTLSAKAYLDQLAYYDSLTGLPNRKLFIERLEWGMKMAKREQRPLVLLDISLDRFRKINESLGMSVGDHLLTTIAERLKQVARGSDIIGHSDKPTQLENMARIASDEFSMVLCGVNSYENASQVCKRLQNVISQPVTIEGQDLYTASNIGIAVYPEDGEDVETLIKHASSAKDFAKRQGNPYLFYSQEMNEHSKAVIKMESDLRRALEENQFELYYQPKVDISRGVLMGMESLIRWIHPEDGFIPPDKFISVAEELDLIVPIGEWVLHEACRKTSEWISAGYTGLKVSVNVSAKQFIDEGFKSSILSALQSSGLKPENLVLEITESMLMGDVENYVNILNEITESGVSFSLDDFGTGYSSLSYLKKFPIKELKIDRSFIIDIPRDDDDCSIVKAIIAMAHGLGLSVVAEGVEEKEQLHFLKKNNCEVIQGYYFSKPLNSVDFYEYLKRKVKL